MKEPIKQAIKIAGQMLDFHTFTVKAILGFSVSELLHGEVSVYRTESQQFAMQMDIDDIKAFGICRDMQFAVYDNAYKYIFQIVQPPVANTEGWAKLQLELLSKIPL